MPQSHIITAVDIGTDSIKTLVVKKNNGDSDLEVLDIIFTSSLGMRKGVVVNPDKVSKNLQNSIAEIREPLRQSFNGIYTNIGGNHLFVTSSHGLVSVSRADQKISREDINRVIQAAEVVNLPLNNEILETFPKEFIIDGQKGIKEPLGMRGLRLEVEILALCVFSPYLKNLTQAILDSNLQINDVIFSPLAAAQAVLTPQQKEVGVALIDIGAGATSLAVFEEGNLIHTAVFPLGSINITNDIAIGLRTEIDIAERIKKEFGSCLLQKNNKKEKIKIPQLKEPLVFSKKMLAEIIEARIEEILDLVNKDLKKISRQGLLPAGIVLTGGGAKLPKIVELTKKELKLPVRIGIPKGISGIEEDPTLATVCGLALRGAESDDDGHFSDIGKGAVKEVIGRIKKILKTFIP
ncbi:cell division protein FtsA [Candidatus Parcubacteria bacterium]|nr:cell division protein FtsA [Candidatus Parcubacteria bacterium]